MLRFLLNSCRRPPIRFGLARDTRGAHRNASFASFLAQSNRNPLDSHRHGAILRSRRFARQVLFVALACGAAWVVVESAKALTTF
ncbi:hypothetical protein [Opitutus terrae]|uniref:hypothetical protein n=1 Tax=Opitutus terrae TaxID=107709 RepID=UPI0002D80229|nr:hypothetical protein [Opitutus terrae]